MCAKAITEIRRGPVTKKFLLRHRRVTAAGCWEWTRGMTKGYGQINASSNKLRVHRVAYELWVGKIPSGMGVLHRCDNPPCFNPAHLFLGTQPDNIRDAASKGRIVLPGFRGEDHPQHKLTETQVRKIRQLCASGMLRRVVAEKFGVTKENIGYIARRATWRHL